MLREIIHSLLALFAGDLPSDNTPRSYCSMKVLVKILSLEYEKFNGCENDCMLFYKDDATKLVCDICG